MLCQPRTALSTALIVNDIRNFFFGLSGASVYGFRKSQQQQFVMSFTIAHRPQELNQTKSRTGPMIPEKRIPGKRRKGTQQCG